MQQEKDEDLRRRLDQDLESLRSLLYTVDPERSTDDARLSAAVEAPNIEDQEYDKSVRELAFEQRAKPKDRTRTEEELALEEKQALESAERKRQKRMRGEDPDSEGESGRRKRLKQIGGDDLEDDFYGEDGFGPGLQEEGVDGSDESEGEDVGVEEGSEDEDDTDADDDEEVGYDTDSEPEGLGSAEEGDDVELVPKRQGKTHKSNPGKELPYTFPCPESHEEFLDILEDINDEDVPTVVHRIRTLHHPSLAEDNKLKLQVTQIAPAFPHVSLTPLIPLGTDWGTHRPHLVYHDPTLPPIHPTFRFNPSPLRLVKSISHRIRPAFC